MVFPDWSPYPDLESAARAYLRDPDVALDALGGVLRGATVLGFTIERFVNEVNGVWQEVAVCDGIRLVLWHGEDVPPGEGPAGSMTSSLRVVPLSAVTEVGCRRRLIRVRYRTGPGRQRRRLPAAHLARRGAVRRHVAGGRGVPAAARRAALRQDAGRRRGGTDRPAWRTSPGWSRPWSVVRSEPPAGPVPCRTVQSSASGPATSTSSAARSTWMHSPGHSLGRVEHLQPQVGRHVRPGCPAPAAARRRRP